MAAYVIADVDVHDPETYQKYATLVQATLDPFEGRFLVRGVAGETLEGDWHPTRTVVIEFPSAEHARGWYTSPEYVKAMAIRHSASTGRIILAEGIRP